MAPRNNLLATRGSLPSQFANYSLNAAMREAVDEDRFSYSPECNVSIGISNNRSQFYRAVEANGVVKHSDRQSEVSEHGVEYDTSDESWSSDLVVECSESELREAR